MLATRSSPSAASTARQASVPIRPAAPITATLVASFTVASVATRHTVPGMAPAGARVRTIPPLVFAIPLVVAWLLHLVAPLPLPLSGARVWLGVLLVAAAVALMAWAVTTMRRAHTTVIPWEEVSRLVTEGPFRFSRNPIYLADALAYLGVTLLVGSWWPLLVFPAVLLAMLRLVISREEEYLAARFGADYAAYRSRVRRWV